MHAIHHRYADIDDHRIDIRGASRHLVVRRQKRVIADSTRPTALSEP